MEESGSKSYLFKSLKTYSSNEWMANVTKKYRSVYEKNELKQVGVELAFFNTKFNEENWIATILLKCYRVEGNRAELLFTHNDQFTVPIEENTVVYHNQWKPTDQLEKGTYKWIAYIDDAMVGEIYFYVESAGEVKLYDNPYFTLNDVKLFKGTKDGVPMEERCYLKQFEMNTTEYVWVQLDVVNNLDADWFCEVFYNFQDDTGLLKESISSFNYFEKGCANERFLLTAGWGADKPGYWQDDMYYINIVFMDKLIAKVPLYFGDHDEEGYVENLIEQNEPIEMRNVINTNTEDIEDGLSVEEIMKDLNDLVGLTSIKKQIEEFVKYVDFVSLRKENGFVEDEDFLLHSVFMGNPGTGKTTVVKLLGRIFKQKGLLSKGHVHEVARADLIGEYIGQTAPMTKKAIDKARGGILFIDEAYMLSRDNERDFGKEAIEVILKEMSDGPGDIAIMAAGYPNEMKSFLNTNPGLDSRFKYKFYFDDYLPDELMEIAEYAAKKRGVHFTKKAKDELKKLLMESYRNRDKNFGNARYATYVVDQAKLRMGMRVLQDENPLKLDKKVLSTITDNDIQSMLAQTKRKKPDIPIDKDLLKEALNELNSLVGLECVKQDVNELVKLVTYYREMKEDVLNKFSFHTVFSGNPGTGKTTVARIIGKVYKALGILERGHVVETDREGLVAGFSGQTAIKTKERIKEANGGILFIDEAYALTRNSASGDNFGQEAIEVILKTMEDKRGDFVVIAAGYPQNMREFIESNPGLESRFDREMNFKDFSQEELFQIAEKMLGSKKLYLTDDAEAYLKNYIKHLIKNRTKFFGNAREIRKLVEGVVKNQNLRMADLPIAERTKEVLEQVILDDVDDFVIEPVVKRATLGFRVQS